MVYNPQNAKKIEQVPAGEVIDGVIISIMDGTPQSMITNEERLKKFKSGINEPAINIFIEAKYDGRVFVAEQLMTYIPGKDKELKDITLYTEKSNLGKFVAQYGELPKVGMIVKLSSNAKGFFKLVI